jgi:Nucleotidyltransferase domain.
MHNDPEDLAIAGSMLKKLIYFDIFSHPLRLSEIVGFCDYPGLNPIHAERILRTLEAQGLVKHQSGFYQIDADFSKISHRITCNKLADKRIKTAVKYSRVISCFPYVRGVFISGSLSKHVMKPDSDIDFFIITKPGRLWACRAFLTLYKKIFLANSFRNFCINYFIDTESLEIPDKNIYTATEIVTLIPMFNYELYREFMASNLWVRNEFPNYREHPEQYRIHPFFMKKGVEFLFNNWIGNWIERKSFLTITRFWEKKFSSWSKDSYALSFRSLPNVSKHHPNAFQEKVLRQYKERIHAFETITGFMLNTGTHKKFVRQ